VLPTHGSFLGATLALTAFIGDEVIIPAPASALTATTTTADEDSFTSAGRESDDLVMNIVLTALSLFARPKAGNSPSQAARG
jgi:hypothetical protein